MEMSLENWVILKPGIAVRMHWSDVKKVMAPQIDKLFGIARQVEKIYCRVDRLDGLAVDKTFSIVSKKLADDISGYLPGDKFRGLEFTVIKDAEGYVPPRLVSVTPFTG